VDSTRYGAGVTFAVRLTKIKTMNKIIISTSLVAMAIGLTSEKANAAVVITSDFSFLSGAPVSGTFTQLDITTTVSSTNTELFGMTSFRDNTGSVATVTIGFSHVITSFSLDVSFVRNDEFINSFNIGNPTSLSGDLVQVTEGVSTSNIGDSGAGSISWTGLNTNSISFSIETPVGAALAVDSFEATAVPEPSSALLLGLASLGLVARRRRIN